MARKRDRAFAMFGAILFLVTSSALTVAVIVSMVQQNKKQDTTSKATNQAKAKQVNPANQLQGKPLAGFTPIASVPELQKIDTSPGTGETVKTGDIVTIDYTGAVAATGIVFQSSKDSGQQVPLGLKKGSVIDGFVNGVPGMKVGGSRRILIPAAQAYGANPPSGIPANADLVFDVTVHKIGK